MQTMLGTPAANVLLASEVDFVNKGAASEMFAGLELVKNHDCFQKAEMYYWQNMSRGSNAEIDYLEAKEGVVVPIEVKASTKGSMQSLWLFMRKKALHHAVRTSLENFGTLEYIDKEAQNALRHIDVVPLYAMSNLYSTTSWLDRLDSRCQYSTGCDRRIDCSPYWRLAPPCARPKDTFLANISHTIDEPNKNVRAFDRKTGTFAHKSSKQTYV